MRENNEHGLVRPQIPTTTNFELKGHILNVLKHIPFFGKDHEEAYKHIDEVVEISYYFNFPNMMIDAVMLRILPITLKDVTKDWLRPLPPGTIMT